MVGEPLGHGLHQQQQAARAVERRLNRVRGQGETDPRAECGEVLRAIALPAIPLVASPCRKVRPAKPTSCATRLLKS